MPLRSKITNPAFMGVAQKSTIALAPLPTDQPNDVLFNNAFGVRLIELNRPEKLNSLNGSMARKILPKLKEFEESGIANIVIMSGNGPKALCAGGDVAALALANRDGGKEGVQASKDYFGLEYKLDHIIATYSKPYIAIMDGITMGGGVGLSVHAPFRIATEKTLFAMPETTIGFFPDVGGSFFLPRLDGEIGTYLALTSERLKGVQALYGGIATHYVDSASLPSLINRLSELSFSDDVELPARLEVVNKTISEFQTGVPNEPIQLSGSIRKAIDRCFSADNIPEIIKRLEAEQKETLKGWAQQTLKTLASRSPTSLKVTLRQLRLGKRWNISEAFVREHQIAAKFMEHPDFTEGVTAKLVNKPATEPVWNPKTLDEVSDAAVDAFFAAPKDKLSLIGGASVRGQAPDYTDYPHAHFALPRESVIKSYFQKTRESPGAIIKRFEAEAQFKPGVREKVTDVVRRRLKSNKAGKWEWVE